MSVLGDRCRPCEGGVSPLSVEEVEKFLPEIKGWKVSEGFKEISLDLQMKNFSDAVDMISKIRDIAEAENHHPDLHLTGYKNLRVELTTHAIGGLSENDFIVAKKINAAF